MENPVLDMNKELDVLKNALQLTQSLSVVGPKQAAILATIGDNITAVAISLNTKLEAMKLGQANKACCPGTKECSPGLTLVEKPTNGEVKAEEAAH